LASILKSPAAIQEKMGMILSHCVLGRQTQHLDQDQRGHGERGPDRQAGDGGDHPPLQPPAQGGVDYHPNQRKERDQPRGVQHLLALQLTI
jgi:hypothetical protein